MNRVWDLECYKNLFLAGFLDENDHLDMFYLSDQPEEIHRACKDSGLSHTCYNLRTDASKLQKYMENPIPSDGKATLLSDFLGTTNEVVKPKEDRYFAYNSLHYDIPLVDYLLSSSIAGRVQISTEALRAFSDQLVDSTRPLLDVRPYIQYGGHIDLAYLNETKIERGRPTVGLKTLVGILGGSIVETESNKTGVSKDVYGDTLYNINDLVTTKNDVFPGYLKTVYDVRSHLLKTYPHLKDLGVTPNSTSATFVEHVVAKDDPIDDDPVVSYLYPAKHIAKKLGVEQRDILEDTKDWYLKNVYQPLLRSNPKQAHLHLAKFQSIYNYYDSFRGKNWNTSARQALLYGNEAHHKWERKKAMRTYGTILPFVDRNGVESSTYVQFSVGGIHGAQINEKQLEADRKFVAQLREKYGTFSNIPKGVLSKRMHSLLQSQSRTSYKGYPKRLSHEIPWFLEQTEETDEILRPEELSPYQAKTAKGKTAGEDLPLYQEQVLDRYLYTSYGPAVHQDFSGYYPMLLINLGAFYDGNGVDPYAQIYEHRIQMKKRLKTLLYESMEWLLTNMAQEGYKLILNSASGILDGNIDTKLRANNKAIAMRVIGQLFTWRIGQALALEGADIPSSNTDGIYAMKIDLETNKRIVDRELKDLYIQIDPEELYLISKDSNNRVELVDGKVVSARGGTVTSWQGARVNNSLSHPAIVDRILTRYLKEANLDGPVEESRIRKELLAFKDEVSVNDFLYYTSWVMRSTSGSLFVTDNDQVHPGTVRTWLATGGERYTRYAVRQMKRGKTLDGYVEMLQDDDYLGDPEVIAYLKGLGVFDRHLKNAVTVADYKKGSEASLPVVSQLKITGLEEGVKLYQDNGEVKARPEAEAKELLSNLDLEAYVRLIAAFAQVWHNKLERLEIAV